MTELIARLIIVSEADNYQYDSLVRDENAAYQTYKDILAKKSNVPNFHWHDWTRLTDACRKPYWDAKIPVETRHQLISEFESKAMKSVFGGLIGHFERNEDMPNEEAAEYTRHTIKEGWLDNADLCHKMDMIVRSACIKIGAPAYGSGFGSRLGKAMEQNNG